MNVLILAAGEGQRLAREIHAPNLKFSKPLLLINGETIIERQIRILKTLGLNNITVVLSSNSSYKRLTKEIEDHLKSKEVKFFYIEHPFDGTEKCWTLFNCKDLFGETLILLGDVIFTEETLMEILNKSFEDILFIGNLHGPTEWSKRKEIWAILIKVNGAEILRKVPNPMIVKETREKEWYWEKSKFWSLFYHLGEKIKIYCPSNFIIDVDYLDDLKMAEEFLRRKD